MTTDDLRAEIVQGCTKIEGMWLASSEQKRLARSQRLFWTDPAAPLDKLLALYEKTQGDFPMADVQANPIVDRLLALIEKLKSMGPAALTVLTFVETLLRMFTGQTPLQSAVSTVQCGPDGCTDCRQLLNASIEHTIAALALDIQHLQCMDAECAAKA